MSTLPAEACPSVLVLLQRMLYKAAACTEGCLVHAVSHVAVSHRCLAPQMRAALIPQLTLLASSDAEAAQHARLLTRRSVHALSLLRWNEWEGDRHCRMRLRQWERVSDVAIGSLHAVLRSLVISEFAVMPGIISTLSR